MNLPISEDRDSGPGEELFTLNRIQRRLEELLGEPAPGMQSSPVEFLGDDLIICGIVGGKDVGKTTLLRSMIGLRGDLITEPEEGTRRPRFFVHQDQVDTLERRFSKPSTPDRRFTGHDLITHAHDAMRRLVLVDLPDFDSEYADHLRIVEETLPLLDRVVWVMSPRKAADRNWLQLLRRFAKDGANVYYVLSKGDELLADAIPYRSGNGRSTASTAGAADVIATQRDWFEHQLHLAGAGAEGSRAFVVAAAYTAADEISSAVAANWGDSVRDRYASDYPRVSGGAQALVEEFNRLRELLLRPISPAAAVEVKQANRRAALQADVERIRQWSRLDLWIKRISAAASPEPSAHAVSDYFPAELRSRLADSLYAKMPSEGEAAGELFAWRTERYPLLRLFGHPMGAVIRLLAKYLAGRPNGSAASVASGGIDAIEPAIRSAVTGFRQHFIEENTPLLTRFRITDQLPSAEVLASRVIARVSQTAQAAAGGFAAQLKARAGRRSWLLAVFLVAITLWFPLLQPLTEAGLLVLGADGFSLTMKAAAKMVAALGPARLLQGLLVVLLIYFLCLAAIYRRALRRVRQLRAQWAVNEWTADASAQTLLASEDELLWSTAMEGLMEPVRQVGRELQALEDQIRQLEHRYE